MVLTWLALKWVLELVNILEKLVKTEKDLDLGKWIILMETRMKVIGKMINKAAKEYTDGVMEVGMKVSLRMGICMERVEEYTALEMFM